MQFITSLLASNGSNKLLLESTAFFTSYSQFPDFCHLRSNYPHTVYINLIRYLLSWDYYLLEYLANIKIIYFDLSVYPQPFGLRVVWGGWV